MGCQESRLNDKHTHISLSIVDPAFLKTQHSTHRKILQQLGIQYRTYMSIECFADELSQGYYSHVVIKQQDMDIALKYMKSINSNPRLFVLDSKSNQQSSDPQVTYLSTYDELFDKITAKKSAKQKSTEQQKVTVDMKILKNFKAEAQSQLFIFQETLKIKNITYEVFNNFSELQESMNRTNAKVIVTDYRYHKEVIRMIGKKMTKVICFCELDDREEYDSQLYFITNNFQQIVNELTIVKAFKLNPLVTTKVFLYSSKNSKFFRHTQIFQQFKLQVKQYKNVQQLLKATKLYFSLCVVCPEDQKELLQKQIANQGCTFRVRVMGIQQQTESSARGLRRIIRQVKRGYVIQKGVTKVVDIIDKYHNSSKFQEIKAELKKNNINFRCYNDLIAYTKTLNFLSPFIICNFSQKNLLVRYLQEVQSRSKIIIFCNKAKITEQVLHENKWAFVSSHFGKIIKFIKTNFVIVPVILDHNQQRIQQKQQKIKNKQHRISALKWADPTSLNSDDENKLMMQQQLSFIMVKPQITPLSLKQISHDASSLLKINNRPIENVQTFKDDLIVSLQFLKQHYKINYPESNFGELLDDVKKLTIQELAIKVRQFFGNMKDMGLKINQSLRKMEKLDQKQLKHLRQVIFLININFIGFIQMPKINKTKLVHWTRDTVLDQCKVDSLIISKNFLVTYEQGTTQAIPGCLKIQIDLDYSTITDPNPFYNSFFSFNERFIFSPYTHFKITSVSKQNSVSVIQLQMMKQSDFLVYYFDENIGGNSFQIFQKQTDNMSGQLIDPNQRNQVSVNIQRCAILKQFRVGNMQKAIKMQLQLIKRQQQTQNFDSKYLGELQFQLVNYYLKNNMLDEVLTTIKQATLNNPNAFIKRQCAAILQKVKSLNQKQQQTQNSKYKKDRTQKCIQMKQQIERGEDSSSQPDINRSDNNIFQNQLQCLQIDQHQCLIQQFA